MWRSKKFVIAAVLVAVLLIAGGIGIAVRAQTGSTDNTTPGKTLLGRVATILGIDQSKVEDAFNQARKDMQSEALDNYLNKLVQSGKITQDQANQYKSWLQSKPNIPNMPMPGFRGGRGGFRMMPGWGHMGTPVPPTTAQ